MGYIAVTTLIGSGLVNGWFLVGNVSGLFATPYGQLLLVKVVLFTGMLALAVSNRFWIVPSLTKAPQMIPTLRQPGLPGCATMCSASSSWVSWFF
jgi:putative copper export protein